jgi:IS30 family transposase
MTQYCHNKSKTQTHLSYAERILIQTYLNLGWSQNKIARQLNRPKSTLSGEIKRSKYKGKYSADIAQMRTDRFKRIARKPAKSNDSKLMLNIERLIKRKWSPEIISHKLGGISHTTIYSITKTIRPEWHKYLAYQKKHRYHKGCSKVLIPDRIDISERPIGIELGDIEADTVISARGGKSCLGVFVDRKTRLYKFIKMMNKGAEEMVKAAATALIGMEVKSITYDNGSENVKHMETNKMFGCKSYFCRPYRSGDKGLIENRNKILRQWLPKGTNFDLISEEELSRIEKEINERPMKCLGWLSPSEAHSIPNPCGLDF